MISRHVKAFLRKYRPVEHWCIDRSGHLTDTFQALTVQVEMEAGTFFKALCGRTEACNSDYAARWEAKKALAEELHKRFDWRTGWCDWKAFSLLFPSVPAGTAIQLGNSTPVRYGQLFACPQAGRVDANRGTSGIDGSTSTAVGAAALNGGLTLFVTGDMSFLYDSNALWNPYITPRFKMVVMKNGGGGIFRFIQGPSGLEELEEFFETPRQVDVGGFASLHGFAYFKAGSVEELCAVLPGFWAECASPALLEIDTAACDNAGVLRAYFKELSNNQ